MTGIQDGIVMLTLTNAYPILAWATNVWITQIRTTASASMDLLALTVQLKLTSASLIRVFLAHVMMLSILTTAHAPPAIQAQIVLQIFMNALQILVRMVTASIT